MIYHLLCKSNILKNEGYERNIKIILVGTIIYIILKYVLIFLVGNKSFIRFLYYIAIFDLIYLLWEQTNEYLNDIKLEDSYSIIDKIKGYFNLKEEKIINNIDEITKKEINNKIKHNLNKIINNKLIFKSKNSNRYNDSEDIHIKNNVNIEILSNDNSTFYESIDIPIYKSTRKDLSINTTEIDTDTESNYIPIYRSKKKQKKKNEVLRFEV